eukprot:UN00400
MASRKLALVTGGNKGIGYAICKQLLQTQCFNVLLATRNIENGKNALTQLKKDIPDLDLNCIDLLQLDVSSQTSIDSSLDYIQTEKSISSLDLLINNAGIASGDEFNASLVKNVFATNFYGAINCTTSYLPLLQSSKIGGRILMMSSRVGAITKLTNNESVKTELNSPDLKYDDLLRIMDNFILDMDLMENEGFLNENGNLNKEDVKQHGWWNSAYGMSKLGLSAYSRILSMDISNILAYNIFVASYCPGFVATDMTAAYGKKIPLGPDDGARGMIMLADVDNCAGDKYESGKFWCLNDIDDEDLSNVDWYNCRI